jgi:hypothetical protein
VPGGDLHLPQRDARLEGAHDEGGPQHVGVDDADSGPLGDGSDLPVGGAAVESAGVVAEQDRA